MATLDNPRLESWRYVPVLNSIVGVVAGHPKLGDGWIITSQVQEMHSDLGWARTLSRRYDLGAKAPHGPLPGVAWQLVTRALAYEGIDGVLALTLADRLLERAEQREAMTDGRH